MSADISRSLISMLDIKQRIGTIFPDAIILNNQLKLVSFSQNILDAIGYSREEMLNRSVKCLSRDTDLEKFLFEKLRPGYFVDEQFEIHAKNGSSIMYTVCGFYLGLITDVNGLIILKLRNLDEINLQHDRIDAKTAELDRFVYVSAHALRGPLATMKGLINLARTYPATDELGFLITQLDQYADKLDDKLHKMIYFAESDKGYEASGNKLGLPDLVQDIESAIAGSVVRDKVTFNCIAADQDLAIENGEVVLSLFRNLVLFFCQQERSGDAKLSLDLHSSTNTTEFVIHARGFVPNDLFRAKLSATNFSYSEILNYPELINYYAVKKIIFKLRAEIQFILAEANEITVLINIPRDIQLSLF